MTEIEETRAYSLESSREYKKPILCSFMGGTTIEKGERILNEFGFRRSGTRNALCERYALCGSGARGKHIQRPERGRGIAAAD
jgi:hypothetical protein